METYYNRITDKKMIRVLFLLCWLVYFSTYLGRLNYSASLAEMVRTGEFTKASAGMIGTGFFFAYGAGQFVSGFLGDRLSPAKMVFTGLFVSALCNLSMTVAGNSLMMTGIWCLNGLFQAFIWSPLIRLMFEYYQTETRIRLCVSLNSSVPIGTMAAYGVTALMIGIAGWRSVFFLSSAALMIMAFVWLYSIKRVEKYAAQFGLKEAEGVPGIKVNEGGSLSMKALIIGSGFLFLMAALFVQGALKDGVTTWIPTYISESYGLSSVMSIITTMMIPVFNLVGVYLASYCSTKIFRDEVTTAGAFFALCAGSLLLLFFFSGHSLMMTFLLLAVSTTAMMAVNTMLIAVLPSYFGVMGRASSVSGILNSSVYAGGAVSTYGIGILSVWAGWKYTIFIWFLMAAASFVICLFAAVKWRKFRRTMFEHV